MKRFIFSAAFVLVCVVFVFAQGETFSDPHVEYTFELPQAEWKMVVKPSASSPNVEYAHGDRMNGHFEIRKLEIKDGEIISDLIQRDKEQKLQFLPGFVAGKEENFAGNFKGRVFNYEYVRSGKNMSGRFYYLRSDDLTVYVVRFTGLRDKLRLLRNQTDSIARTFDIKKGN
jgi:hypothetical protein